MKSIWRVAVPARPDTEPVVAALLEARLCVPVVVCRDEDSGRIDVVAYPAKLPASAPALRRALVADLKALGVRAPQRRRLLVRPLPRQNWAESWKRHFKPIEIGPRLLIKPGWSRRRARPGQRVVILDPGLSFGTGQHETTSFCLHQLCLCRHPARPQSFLDIGPGSGILAIAAAKLGYSPVQAFDFDPESVRASRANVRKNRVDKLVRPRHLDLTRLPLQPARRFDVICANLTADLLCAQAARIASRLAPGGRLIIAGVLRSQFAAVTKTLRRFHLTLRVEKSQNSWRSGQFAFQGD